MPRQCAGHPWHFSVTAGAHVALPRDLVAIVQIVDRVKDRRLRSGISTIGRSGNTRLMLAMKISHSRSPQKSSHMKKPPRSRYSRNCFGLCVGQVPFAHLHGIEPGPVEHVVAIVQIDRLLDGAHMEAGQPADGLRESGGRRADNPASKW